MKLATKKSECVRGGHRLLAISKKEVTKKLISSSNIMYCATVEPFPMAYAYSEKLVTGDKFICETFSIN